MIDNLDISKISDQVFTRKNLKKGRNYSSLREFEVKFNQKPKLLHLDYNRNTKKLEVDKTSEDIESNREKMYNNTVENNPTEPLDEYFLKVQTTMVKYHTETNIDDDFPPNKTTDSFSDLSEQDEREILNALKNNSVSRFHGLSEESMMKILIRNKGFKNPFESGKVLKHNKDIYSDVSSKFLVRQKKLYSEAIDKINSYTMKFKIKMPKIKITTVMPKHLEQYSHHTNANKESPKKIVIEKKKKKDQKQKFEVMVKAIIVNDYSKLFSHYVYAKKNFPEGREQFSWNYNNEIILWGGIGANKNNFIWELNPVSLEWTKSQSELTPPPLRYGHTGIVHQKRLYVFGGKTKLPTYSLMCDLDIFNLEDKTWLSPILYTKSTLQLRRNHVADLIGQQMIVHGGINENNEYLNDTYLLTMQPMKWTHCSINEETPGPALAGHACCLVLPSDLKYNPRMTIYKFPDLGVGRAQNVRV